MDDKFEDKIRESLNSPPDYPFEERVWQDLEGRLDQLDKRQPRKGFPFWWLPVLAAAVPLLLLFWLWGAYQQQGAELAQLQQQSPKGQVTIMDTIVRRTIITKYDTIYRTVYQTTETVDNPAFKHGQLTASPSLWQGADGSFHRLLGEKSSPTSAYQNQWLRWQSRSSIQGIWPKWSKVGTTKEEGDISPPADLAAHEMAIRKWNQRPTKPLPFRFFFLNDEGEEALPSIVTPTTEQRKKTLTDRIAPILPSEVRIGLSGGTFAASGLPEVENQANFSGALLVELAYSRHLSFVLGAEYLANTFGLKHDDTDFNGFPILPPNTPGDELEKLQGDFRYWQFPLGVKYRMLVKKRLSPYVGGGIMAIRPYQSLLNYEYENSSDNYYLLSRDNLLGRQLLLEDAWLMLGVEYYLGKNWSVLLDANAQWSFGKANSIIEKREFLKGRLGFGYAF